MTANVSELAAADAMDELTTALVGLVERELMATRVGGEWRNSREDERVRGEVVVALRAVVAHEVRATLRAMLAVPL